MERESTTGRWAADLASAGSDRWARGGTGLRDERTGEEGEGGGGGGAMQREERLGLELL